MLNIQFNCQNSNEKKLKVKKLYIEKNSEDFPNEQLTKCPNCIKQNNENYIRYMNINLHEAVYKCEGRNCMFPFKNFIFRNYIDNTIYKYVKVEENDKDILSPIIIFNDFKPKISTVDKVTKIIKEPYDSYHISNIEEHTPESTVENEFNFENFNIDFLESNTINRDNNFRLDDLNLDFNISMEINKNTTTNYEKSNNEKISTSNIVNKENNFRLDDLNLDFNVSMEINKSSTTTNYEKSNNEKIPTFEDSLLDISFDDNNMDLSFLNKLMCDSTKDNNENSFTSKLQTCDNNIQNSIPVQEKKVLKLQKCFERIKFNSIETSSTFPTIPNNLQKNKMKKRKRKKRIVSVEASEEKNPLELTMKSDELITQNMSITDFEHSLMAPFDFCLNIERKAITENIKRIQEKRKSAEISDNKTNRIAETKKTSETITKDIEKKKVKENIKITQENRKSIKTNETTEIITKANESSEIATKITKIPQTPKTTEIPETLNTIEIPDTTETSESSEIIKETDKEITISDDTENILRSFIMKRVQKAQNITLSLKERRKNKIKLEKKNSLPKKISKTKNNNTDKSEEEIKKPVKISKQEKKKITAKKVTALKIVNDVDDWPNKSLNINKNILIVSNTSQYQTRSKNNFKLLEEN